MLIQSPGISSSESSTYLLPCSALALRTLWSSCTTYVVLALVSVLIWALILLAGGSSLDEPSMLFLCLNISGSVWIKPLRPDVNAGAILSSFYSCLTAFSAAIAVTFSSFDMMRIKLKQKIKTKYFPPAALTLSIYSRRVQSKVLTYYAISYWLLSVAQHEMETNT